MANPEHLAVLKRGGIQAWNHWRRQNPNVKADLSGAYLVDTNLIGANLIGANLIGANLSGADLAVADLIGADLAVANLSGAHLGGANLSGARLSGAHLSGVRLRGSSLSNANFSRVDLSGIDLSGLNLNGANFSGANLNGANFSGAHLSGANFSGVNLSKVNLSKVDLKGVNFSGADFRELNFSQIDLSYTNLKGANLEGVNLVSLKLVGADLTEANLATVQALNADFENATFTGACIQDWNINSATNLENVIADHIYLKADRRERRPHNPNTTFAPGEFTKLFQKALETIDLIFASGVNWDAFLTSFQQLKMEIGDRVAVQAIEKKGEAFVVRVEAPEELDKAAIERSFKQQYDRELQLIETQYRQQLNAKDDQLAIYRQQNASLENIINLLAARPPAPIQNIIDISDMNQSVSQSARDNTGQMNAIAAGRDVTVSQQNRPSPCQSNREAIALLDQLEAMLKGSDLPPEKTKDAIADLSQAKTEADRADPDSSIVSNYLQLATTRIEKLGNLTAAAGTLVERSRPLLDQLLAWFGGNS